MRYIRLEATYTDGKEEVHGFYWVSMYLYDNDRLYTKGGPYDDHDRVWEIFHWFGQNLKVPTKFDRSSNKYKQETKGLSWFKETSRDHIDHMMELASIIKRYGVIVEIKKTTRPGYIIFEDDYQVVAVPFKNH